MSNPVFFVPPGSLDGLGAGATATVTGSEGRHAATVKRLAAGEPVDLVDGRGVRGRGRVSHAEGDALAVVLDAVEREERAPYRLVLVQALAKGDRDELAAEAATELGVDAVVPWQAERSIVRWKGERAAKSLAKWRSVVAAAAKQSRRAWVPDVDEAHDGAALTARISRAALAVVLHEDATAPLGPVLEMFAKEAKNGAAPKDGEVLFVVGPEGGISPAELTRFTDAGAQLALLGPHVLRSSTAGPAALAIAADRLGRWSGRS
ncbi:16S rRNA (uracil(1498)-N(3))-methyltransferase [Sinomonas sp. ASV322]|uniref:16S rRNA (uracil(1498)-N(3))-methyltransferase n=1 Tax=Sinomonas sp. ASV322 TaxID=3041920 RepID=UPI0027DDD841|nr:16S rRNA (uracil(1498)-N(3))-methyltransferase [Sinomonas sp. ASV322]MDQ4501103.1 16S rRNA (uracil(1498)-N(3))-methyltransferase [Sinomonas sp. ASV322]